MSEDMILQRLETARKRLVDVSLRNRFLNYRPSKRTGLKIVHPDPQAVFDALVGQSKSARFVERPEPQLLQEENGFLPGGQSTRNSIVFTTDESKQNLDRKLLQIWRDATSLQEEQGINLLFIALGALFWYESDAATELRCAPLIFVPVLIEREQGSKFLVRFEGTDLIGNLSLAEMLRQQFYISLKTFEDANEDTENLNLQRYFDEVRKTVREQKRWSVDENFAVMAFFNFTKYIMYRDLDPANWTGERSPGNHKVIRQLLGDEDENSDNETAFLDHNTDLEALRPVEQALEVYDADSSQIAAIMQAKRASLMIIEGPPGTGKSQTITNLIAEAVYEGQKVLFVSEKRAALDVVWKRLQEADIAAACLELHSSKASKKNFYEQISSTYHQSPNHYEQKDSELKRLSELRDRLNSYCHALHTPLPQRGVTPYRCIAEICRLGKEHKPFIGSFSVMKDWSAADFERKHDVVQQLETFIKRYGIPSQSSLWGCGLKSILLEEYEQIQGLVRTAISNIEKVLDCVTALSITPEEVRKRVRRHKQSWEKSIQDMECIISQYHSKWFRVLVPKYLFWKYRLSRLWEENIREEVLPKITEAVTRVMAADACIGELLNLLQATDDWKSFMDKSYEEQLQWLNMLASTPMNAFENIARFNALREEANKENLQGYAEWAATRKEAATELVKTLERTWFSGALSEAFKEHPILRDFADEHEELIHQFRDLDKMLLKINRLRVLIKHWERIPLHRGAGSLGKLQRELQKSRAHKPIRQIMKEAGDVVLAIKPVFMMSPLSVAMYLPPEGLQFDLVIFDEASQVKPEDAFGAILRAKRSIIVGDSKQLPPTAFFDRLMESDSAEDEDVTTGMESILDLAGGVIPERHPLRKRLRWHYRSKHHSLIACSNRLFYDDSLIVAPNPETKSHQLGIVFHYLPDATYDRGGSRRNQKEAEVVAKAVIEHVQKNPHLSLGVAAFSIAQQQAIQDELERLRRNNPEYDIQITGFDKNHQHEPLFVKNLETVQGDERDVVFISVGYGKDEKGYLSMNFGPLNKEGGERRLNVLITRARTRCEVFSSICYSDIRMDESPPAGIAALRTFLHYAETGEMDVPAPTGKEPMSDFEEAVIHFLKEQGYQIVPQVGSAGFYIDIGVIDPNHPERFALGIECDGAQYHSSKTARDRDRLRQQILEERGWRIYRVWSTSWYRNTEAEKKRLLDALQAAMNSIGSQSDETLTPSSNATALVSGDEEQSQSALIFQEANDAREDLQLPPYKFASLDASSLLGSSVGQLRYDPYFNAVVEVARVESPVHIEELIRRVREGLGYGRAGKRIRESIEEALRAAQRSQKVEIDGKFVWIVPRNQTLARNRSQYPAQYKKLGYVHPAEIQEAILFATHYHYGIEEGEICSEVLKLLGFERVTANMRQVVNGQVQLLLKEGRLVKKEGILRVP